MAQEYELHIPELRPLVEQLYLAHQGLEQLIGLLCQLKIRVDLPDLNLAQVELCLVGQELILRRSSHQAAGNNPPLPTIIGEDSRIRVAAGLVRSMAEMDEAVLIQGATGSGKSLFARAIHQQGKRSQRPLITVPCGLLNNPDAMARTWDFFHEADNGSLILEDIDDLQTAAQSHLLSLLQQPAACRLISLTRNDPDVLVQQGKFSPLLLEQLRNCHIALPDLASRGSDIERLARYYLRRCCEISGVAEKQLSPEYLDLLALYSWPGNVRELINTLEQSLLCSREQKTLYAKDLPAHIRIQTLHLSAARKKGL